MGGRIAEEIALDGQQTTGAGNDIEVATTLARKMVCEWGMSDKLGPIAYTKNESEPFLGRDIARPKAYSEATAQSIDREVHDLVMAQYNRAKDILLTHRDALERLALALIEREALGLEEVKAAIEGRALPPKPEVPKAAETPVAGEAKDVGKKDDAVRPAAFPVAEPTG
jgi:cell division protease FtsH